MLTTTLILCLVIEMSETKRDLEEMVATREHLVTDQGNGMSYCSNCQYNLGTDPSIVYKECPGCEYKLIEGKLYLPQGGSDF